MHNFVCKPLPLNQYGKHCQKLSSFPKDIQILAQNKKKPTGIGNHKFCDNKLRRTTSKAAIEDHYQIDMNELSNENEMNSMSLFAIVTTTIIIP